jgi:hypothetical protein
VSSISSGIYQISLGLEVHVPGLFFQLGMRQGVYHGSYTGWGNVPRSQAYASAMNVGLEVRGGLPVRQIHHCGPCSATRSPAPS